MCVCVCVCVQLGQTVDNKTEKDQKPKHHFWRAGSKNYRSEAKARYCAHPCTYYHQRSGQSTSATRLAWLLGTPLPSLHMRNQFTSQLGGQAREPVTCFRSPLLQFCALVTQSCLIFATPWTVVCGLQGPSVHGISQVGILEWGAIPFSRGFSRHRNQTQVSCIIGRYFTVWTTYWAAVGAPVKSCLNFLPGFINFYWLRKAKVSGGWQNKTFQ